MPELPEVETTRRALQPVCEGQKITEIVIRNRRLRWPIPTDIDLHFRGQTIQRLRRRSKYLLFDTVEGSLILHLGMSGSLCHVPRQTPPRKHDHVDIVLDSGRCLRLHDPRRFGSLLWAKQPEEHKLLAQLGPEPLDCSTDELATHLYNLGKNRKVAVKNFIMNAQIVVGVGNIYANEALFLAGIRPARAAGRLTQNQWQKLAGAIQDRLRQAIAAGGTTLRDFQHSDGKPGYFAQELAVYNRGGESCPACGSEIKQQRHNQRSSYYCPGCQH
ncbi:MAG: DNA-formamidopyrimidine glycosylase [Gammaproteobacteria bacterium]|nr:MAG: DNA-formamidopyrimidine glycosylase [Gammaproteobacteria bacterium]